MRALNRLLAAGLFVALMPLLAVACDDDDDGGDEPTPTATFAATPTPFSPSPTALATLAPGVTPGPAATIDLTAEPQALGCDGTTPSVVTARVTDATGQPVADGTVVNFSVVTLGSVDPVNAQTAGGIATTEMTALAEGQGVVVNVTSGEAAASIRIDCQ